MSNQATFYLTDTILGLVLALQLTHFWLRCERDKGIFYWLAGCWIFVVTDTIFTLRGTIPDEWGRVLPTSLVTLAHGVLWVGALQAAGLRPRVKSIVALAVGHAALLLALDAFGAFSNARIVIDRLIWSGLCFAAYGCLRKAPRPFWGSLNSPAAIFFAQGVFFVVRMAVALVYPDHHGHPRVDSALLFIGNVDVLLFNGSVFVSLLLTLLHLRQEELASARVEMQTLSGLLPVCAWCKKVRDDNGYWSEIAEYFARKNSVTLTHGICQACSGKFTSRTVPPGGS